MLTSGPLGRPSPRLAALWRRDGTSVEERVITDPNYLPGLEHAWQQHLEAIPASEGPTGTSCMYCNKKPQGNYRKLCASCYRIKRELDLAREVKAELDHAGGGGPSSPLLLDPEIIPLPRRHNEGCEHGPGAGLPVEGESAPVRRVEFERTCALCKKSFPPSTVEGDTRTSDR